MSITNMAFGLLPVAFGVRRTIRRLEYLADDVQDERGHHCRRIHGVMQRVKRVP